MEGVPAAPGDADASRIDCGMVPIAVRLGSMSAWRFDQERLTEVAQKHADRYRAALPFPHVTLDGIFPDALLEEVVAAFPSATDPGWLRHDTTRQRKLQWEDAARLPPAAAHFVALLQSAAFVRFLERLTGITGLVGDPECQDSGPHRTESGGYLKIHADQNLQDRLWLYRCIDVIVFLNRRWDAHWGGELELWNSDMSRVCEKISPQFNRTVIFSVLPPSNHGQPDPTRSPLDTGRCSIAQYYYISRENPYWSGYQRRVPGFWARPGERRPKRAWHHVRSDVLPPLVLRELQRLRNRRRERGRRR